MAITFSKYVRQGKKTFRFHATSGGVYGSNVSYEYGYFYENIFRGLRYSSSSETEIEYDDDEKDGIGNMTTTHKKAAWLGTFVDGKKEGFCVALDEENETDPQRNIFFFEGEGLNAKEIANAIRENGEKGELSENEIAYFMGDNVVIYKGDTFGYIGELYNEEEPYFSIFYDENEEFISAGFFIDNEEIPFQFNDWETMPVDPVDEDGFSVLREMDFFESGNVRYTITEGLFANGKLNGFGTRYYNSEVNGFHRETKRVGIFKDGELEFGLKRSYETRSRPIYTFGYADGREIEKYGAEIIYDGKKYIGEAVDGVPNGIGCLFVSDEKMVIGTFKNGKPHGFGATYKFLDGKWIPYDFERELKDQDFYRGSVSLYGEGEVLTDASWEEFFDKYEDVKKV